MIQISEANREKAITIKGKGWILRNPNTTPFLDYNTEAKSHKDKRSNRQRIDKYIYVVIESLTRFKSVIQIVNLRGNPPLMKNEL